MRDLLRHVRRTPERLLHPLRRRKALEALRARTRPKTLLVICHGNICRSPFAAGFLRRTLAPVGIAVHSAGFIGFNRPAPPEALAAAERHGLSLSDHRSRPVTADLARNADLIIVMEPSQGRTIMERFGRRPADIVILGDLDPLPVETRTIRDPVNDDREVFDQVYARVARCARELVTVLAPDGATSS
jgi:low molecular weight protein-tyrosine phosphatase